MQKQARTEAGDRTAGTNPTDDSNEVKRHRPPGSKTGGGTSWGLEAVEDENTQIL